jgi:hypothetical protein
MENQPHRRFHWEEAPWYIYSSDEGIWTTGAASDNEARLNHKQGEDLVVVTWNVLFDIFDGGLETDELHLDCSSGATNPSQARWEMLASMLHSSEPDLVSLQEATPAFVEILLKCEWIKAEYACSASPSSLQSVSPSGGKRRAIPSRSAACISAAAASLTPHLSLHSASSMEPLYLGTAFEGLRSFSVF